MKTFSDLKFESNDGDEIAYELFPNHYGISVVRGPYSEGGRMGLYEIAVIKMTPDMKRSEICYDTPVTKDVIGHLKPEYVTEYMIQIQKL